MKGKKLVKSSLCVTMSAAVILGAAAAGDYLFPTSTLKADDTTVGAEPVVIGNTEAPKYVFMFIGDGLSYPQIQLASDYLGALADDDENSALKKQYPAVLDGNEYLNFMTFEGVGTAVTYDSTSFCPDSASTATSLSTGHKTYSGSINVSEDGTVQYETIAEKVKAQLGYKVGIITSVNLDHATPAAYYAHQKSRNDYYKIGLELVESGFDFFAGGEFLCNTVTEGDAYIGNIHDVAEDAGYTVITTQQAAEKLTAEDGKAIVIAEEPEVGTGALAYELDRDEHTWALADYVEKGIEVLDNETGFFMMVEGGKIDWACHANDAASTVNDVLAFEDAVQVAVDFYEEHKDETLIVVTGDHETGGLTIGFVTTKYDTFLENLSNQKISYTLYDAEYAAKYKERNASFKEVLADVEELFGLVAPANATETTDERLLLTEYEMEKLQAAYNRQMGKNTKEGNAQQVYELYGGYQPLSVTLTHILNNKSGVSYTSTSHTGLPVAVLAEGKGAKSFSGYYDNTEVYDKLAALLGIQ